MTWVDSFGRSMMYKTQDGKSVRVRTCNDHVLIVVADKASSDTRLNTEGTDYLLIVMPDVERTPGRVRAYLPTEVAVRESRTSHQAWLDSNPNTKGDNKTFCPWFRKNAPFARSGDYETRWAEYRLSGEAYTQPVDATVNVPGVSATFGVNAPTVDSGIKAVVETARQMVSKAAGVWYFQMKDGKVVKAIAFLTPGNLMSFGRGYLRRPRRRKPVLSSMRSVIDLTSTTSEAQFAGSERRTIKTAMRLHSGVGSGSLAGAHPDSLVPAAVTIPRLISRRRERIQSIAYKSAMAKAAITTAGIHLVVQGTNKINGR